MSNQQELSQLPDPVNDDIQQFYIPLLRDLRVGGPCIYCGMNGVLIRIPCTDQVLCLNPGCGTIAPMSAVWGKDDVNEVRADLVSAKQNKAVDAAALAMYTYLASQVDPNQSMAQMVSFNPVVALLEDVAPVLHKAGVIQLVEPPEDESEDQE